VGVGNQLAVKHGAQSELRIAQLMPAKLDELAMRYAEEIPYVTAADAGMLRDLARYEIQLELMDAWMVENNLSLMTPEGGMRAVAVIYFKALNGKRETQKALGVGPMARAQMVQAMAGAGRDALEVKAAQERLRAKQNLKVLGEGTS
jgi:hypothetical protein